MSSLADANELVKAMKKAARDEREASKPVNVFFGEVVSASPLKINVEQKMELGAAQLVLCRNVTDYTTMATVQWQTEKEEQTHRHQLKDVTDDGGDRIASAHTEEQDRKHTHDIEGTKQLTIHNALGKGEQVVLIRQQEGQKFIVVDRIGGRP
ncbi:DUF2577 domain-containing protein [uncultured Acetatifactor sp.]|uniref:DUF2577 domain-containing protein n=1 Tax=uncultured Acetatifactor sp. TaxID=1671927 RepID=UPI0026240563|nr:DUF2577 domain-containing protein [uncultured Acetatifactor sp.]